MNVASFQQLLMVIAINIMAVVVFLQGDMLASGALVYAGLCNYQTYRMTKHVESLDDKLPR